MSFKNTLIRVFLLLERYKERTYQTSITVTFTSISDVLGAQFKHILQARGFQSMSPNQPQLGELVRNANTAPPGLTH